ncbi:MAG: 16S rRNA (guanine(966)-N(2))-methyltransferase RsmD [Bacteroidia bacterium]|jgi:16S rRNA (guanine(966)-N(2))-methyltransferase RsmD
MRIIAGTHRGRILAAPKGLATRPMLGRVREAIFNRLSPWTEGARVLDLFSGTGSLGIEALSRGAEFVRFLERGKEARDALLRNLEDFGLQDKSEAKAGDALAAANHAPLDSGPWDIVFFDPPYPLLDTKQGRDDLLVSVRSIIHGPLAEDGVFVYHTPAGIMAERDFGTDIEAALGTWGTTDIWFLGRSEDAHEQAPDLAQAAVDLSGDQA